MKLAQLVPSYTAWGSVSLAARNLDQVLKELGFETQIFAEQVASDGAPDAVPFSKFHPKHWDAVIYHLSTSSIIAEEMVRWEGLKRFIVYHNVIPSHYFRGIDESARDKAKNAREQLFLLKDVTDCAFTISSFNEMELWASQYQHIESLPVWFHSNTPRLEPDRQLEGLLQDGYVNFLSVGKLAPHKCQHELIKTFYIYKTHINPKSRLILIGSQNKQYVDELKQLIQRMNLEDVWITGNISELELDTYYRNATLFLSMSEYEESCFSLLEAMQFGVPVIAYNTGAVGETLGTSGVKLKSKDYKLTAELLHEVVGSSFVRSAIIQKQYERLEAFQYEAVKQQIVKAFGAGGLLESDSTNETYR